MTVPPSQLASCVHPVSARLRGRKPVRDDQFDLAYPPEIRRVSSKYWTPVDVAYTAAHWLEPYGCKALVDIGAGAGKFCIVASLILDQTITGIEQRANLIEIGTAAAASYGAKVDYVHGTLETFDASGFDAFYMFNPFGENLYDPKEQLDSQVELSALRWMHDLTIVEHWLDNAPQNTCVLTFHGFGGRMPSNYQLARETRKGDGYLRLWHKTSEGPGRASTPEDQSSPSPKKRRTR